MAPYEALYGRKCRTPLCWTELGERQILGPELVSETKNTVKVIRDCLKAASDQQKSYANLKRKDIEFLVGDQVFLKDIDAETEQRHQQLEGGVRKMIVAPMANSTQKLTFIDSVQRLGVSYRFTKEIEDELENIYHNNNDAENDLYTTSLRFRLLREHGFNVSCEVFNKFKDEQGDFKSSLTSDVRGLLDLYEASYLRVHGEDILDEAISFTTDHLTLAVATLEYPLSEHVSHALKKSIRRGLPRIEARHYLSVYQDIESHNTALLEFAKIDFNMLQLLHRKELSEICRWWKDLDFKRKLPYMIQLAQAFLMEAKWTLQNHKPSFEEFKATALQTTGYAMLAITALVGMGDIVTPETFTWAANNPKIIQASTIICRFMDDVAEHKFKQRREDDFSGIECYMEEYGVMVQEAYNVFYKHIESAWKDVNKGFLKPTKMPIEVLNRILNLARVMNVLYSEGDGYTYVGKATKGIISILLIEPVTL
ncbi:hypothetical protein ES288_D05G433400v1 [Gossypium darwinii]|uniref:(+)-delta-cadinene synthase n=1 Tax=Gossypium darwinii TaxID=34276 RepID=A0A5D2CRC5_GOSDA|nr:hypothetical protein ES288_D05G433400v1 [Gossypium darwinii]